MTLTLLFFVFSALASQPPLEDPPAVTPGKDPLMENLWHLRNSRTVDAWTITEGDPRITVAVVDSGIHYNHPELNANIRRKRSETPHDKLDNDENGYLDDWIGWDYVRGNWLPFDKAGHGTFMASIIAAVGDNAIGLKGVCPRCSILPIRFINGEGLGDTEDAIEGIYYAANEGASVISLSNLFDFL